MTKEQCTALIKAIQQTAVFMMQNGVSIRNAISNTTADAVYVSGLISDYGDAIEAIIDEIPDDETPADGGGNEG